MITPPDEYTSIDDVHMMMFKLIMRALLILIHGLGKERFTDELERDCADFLKFYGDSIHD